MRARMNKGLLITIIGGAAIVILTARYVFTRNSANPSSVPYLKPYALALINNERIIFHLQHIRALIY
jgi:hypothetical protein